MKTPDKRVIIFILYMSYEKETDMLLGIGLSILLGSVVLYMVIMTMILPKAMLKVTYRTAGPVDRGVKRCTFEGKLCNVYTSSKENRPYIKQYLLLRESDHKILKCKVAPNVEYLDYDIVLFNRYGKVFKVINVKEDILGMDTTRNTRLPKDTAYVNIVIRQVNRTKLKKTPSMKVSGFKIFKFSIVTMVLTAAEAFVVRACCSLAFGDVYRESFIASRFGFIVIALLAVFVGVVGAISASISASRRARK